MEELRARDLISPVGDDLIRVHIGLRTASRLPYDEREVLVESAADDLVARLRDSGELLVGHFLGLDGVIGDSGGFFEDAEGVSYLTRHSLDTDADEEILMASLGLSRPVLVSGDFDLAH